MPFLSGNSEVYPSLDWPYDFPIQDYYIDAVPLMDYYPSDPLYETLTLATTEPTQSVQGLLYILLLYALYACLI